VGASALMLCVCDQPWLSTEHLDALWVASLGGMRLAASQYGGLPGVPAVFPDHYFPRLSRLRGDRGAAAILRAAPELVTVPWPLGSVDVDVPADLAALE